MVVKVLQGAAALLAVLLILAVVTVLVATAGWRRATAEALLALEAGAEARAALDPVDTATVPPVVARYLARAIPPGAQPIRLTVLEQEGTFQMGEGDAGWRPFIATQHVRAYPPGFLWDARIAMALLVPVRVRDGYLDGRGTMKGAVWSTLVMVDAQPTRELAEGALYRYLAEAAWMPTRLLPGEGLAWRAVDESTAEATLRDGDLAVSVLFRFDAQGDIVGIHVPRRGREVDGASVPTPWTGRFWSHQDVDGFRIPMEGEVAWVVDGVEVPYWRGRVSGARFDGAGGPPDSR
ncbi:MAG: hypothetical protein AMXMBFR53_11710 [Gemmatimonadota bacterium]